MRTSILAALFGVALLPLSALADDLDLRLQKLDEAVSRQAETINSQQKTIEEMKELLNSGKTAGSQSVDNSSSKTSGFFGGSLMNNPYISVILDAKGYVSNLNNNELSPWCPRLHHRKGRIAQQLQC